MTPTPQRGDGNPSQLGRNPNFSERNPSRAEQIPNPAEQNPNSKSSISFAESSLFNDLRRPPRHFFSSSRFRLQNDFKTPRQSGRCVFARFVVGPSVFVSGSPSVFQAGEGLAPFTIAEGVFVRRLDAILSDLAAVSRKGAKKGTLESPELPRVTARGLRTPGKDRAIDPMSGKNTPA